VKSSLGSTRDLGAINASSPWPVVDVLCFCNPIERNVRIGEASVMKDSDSEGFQKFIIVSKAGVGRFVTSQLNHHNPLVGADRSNVIGNFPPSARPYPSAGKVQRHKQIP